MASEWRPVPGHPPYEVKADGHVRNGRTGCVLATKCLGPHSTPVVSFRVKEGSTSTLAMSTCVASAFLPNPHGYRFIRHIDGDRFNNCVENLEWCAKRPHTRHARKNAVSERTPEYYEAGTGLKERLDAEEARHKCRVCKWFDWTRDGVYVCQRDSSCVTAPDARCAAWALDPRSVAR